MVKNPTVQNEPADRPNANLPDQETLNGNLTARPSTYSEGGDLDLDQIANALDYGDMNEQDAKESGYTNERGEAVSMAKEDVKGSPTGALTEIGAGRSSVVHKHEENETKH